MIGVGEGDWLKLERGMAQVVQGILSLPISMFPLSLISISPNSK